MSATRFDPAAHAQAMRAGGFWVDKNYDTFLQQTIAATPEKLALLAERSDRAEPRRFSYSELGDLIARAAAEQTSAGFLQETLSESWSSGFSVDLSGALCAGGIDREGRRELHVVPQE